VPTQACVFLVQSDPCRELQAVQRISAA
jgi:hypothetical protein